MSDYIKTGRGSRGPDFVSDVFVAAGLRTRRSQSETGTWYPTHRLRTTANTQLLDFLDIRQGSGVLPASGSSIPRKLGIYDRDPTPRGF